MNGFYDYGHAFAVEGETELEAAALMVAARSRLDAVATHLAFAIGRTGLNGEPWPTDAIISTQQIDETSVERAGDLWIGRVDLTLTVLVPSLALAE